MDEKILLLDESGKEIEFLILATFGLDDNNYAALLPTDDMEGLTYILRLETDENGDTVLLGIDDDEELQDAVDAYEEIQNDNLQ